MPDPMPASFPPLTRVDGSPVRALVVDDEASLGELLRMALRYEGWEVQTAANGQDALALARTFAPDVVVLDVMLPDLDGLQVLRRLREAGSDVPVLFLTAKDAVDDRVAGLTAGGDDYVTKPFSLDEVIARLRGLLRRNARIVSAVTDPEVRVGDLVLNEDTYEVVRDGVPVALTATEFELLRYLMRYDFAGRSSIVEIYISYLRKKIDDGRSAMIHTVRGVGYTIKPPVSEPAA
jgi:two-component system OmpR family response regulator